MKNKPSPAPLHQVVGQLRDALHASNPLNIELSGRGFEVWSDHHPVHGGSYVWAEGSDDNMLLLARLLPKVGRILDIIELADAAMRLRNNGDPDRQMGRVFDQLTHALSLLHNPSDQRADAQGEHK